MVEFIAAAELVVIVLLARSRNDYRTALSEAVRQFTSQEVMNDRCSVPKLRYKVVVEESKERGSG